MIYSNEKSKMTTSYECNFINTTKQNDILKFCVYLTCIFENGKSLDMIPLDVWWISSPLCFALKNMAMTSYSM